ncbi:hypothetical protein, partial [Thiolapillus sp.]|uniref:hypothetical protein n=1 Tax=Thiolapillus sp. TaxID=2017437 RepID=UPI003AF8DABF
MPHPGLQLLFGIQPAKRTVCFRIHRSGLVHPLPPAVAVHTCGAQVDDPSWWAAAFQALQKIFHEAVHHAGFRWRQQVVDVSSPGRGQADCCTAQVTPHRGDAHPGQFPAAFLAAYQAADSCLSQTLCQTASHVAATGNQACLRPRDRFRDIPVPKIDSAFDNLFVPQPSWSPSTAQQLRKLVAAPYLAP